ncbi:MULTISPECIES: hypothetical protein [unclassified Streptomyces]
MATTDPATLSENSTWYLATNLPRPGSPRAQQSGHCGGRQCMGSGL